MLLSEESLFLKRQPTLECFDVQTVKPCQLNLMEHLLKKIMDNTGFELKLVTYSKYLFV